MRREAAKRRHSRAFVTTLVGWMVGTAAASGSLTITFSSPAKVSVDKEFVEPSIEVAPNGDLYIVDVSNLDEGVSLPPFRAWRSADNGTSWTEVSPPVDPTIVSHGDVDIAIDQCGMLFVAFTQALTKLYVFESSDSGASWTKRDLTTVTNAPGGPDRPWITAGTECGRVYLVHLGYSPAAWYYGLLDRQVVNGQVRWRGGATFEIFAHSSALGNIVFVPSSGYLFVVYRAHSLEPGHLAVARSADHGVTVTVAGTVTSLNQGHLGVFPVITYDSSGSLYVAYTLRTSGELKYSYSTDNAEAWSSPRTVSPDGGSNALPWTVAGGQGKLDITWYRSLDNSNGNPNYNDGPWYVWFAQSLNAASLDATFSYAQVTQASVHEETLCTHPCENNADRDLGDLFQVDADSWGYAKIAFGRDVTDGGALVNPDDWFTKQLSGSTI